MRKEDPPGGGISRLTDAQKAERERRKGDGQEAPIGPRTTGILKTMTFAPIKYVVPDILVEGLTLLAGKPKVGKSWLLLHTAIAVARGGFTLGDLHCIEGECCIARWRTTNGVCSRA